MLDNRLAQLATHLASEDLSESIGYVDKCYGPILEVTGMSLSIGTICEVCTNGSLRINAEVIGVRKNNALMMSFQDTKGVAAKDKVVIKRASVIQRQPPNLGTILDCFGREIGAKESISISQLSNSRKNIRFNNPLARERIQQQLLTGLPAVDLFLPIGIGQRMGIFAGSGVGKSTLLGQIVNQSSVDVNVIALVGERGREVNEFIDEALGEDGLTKSVMVISTAEESPLAKVHAAQTAMSIAEDFAADGKQVLFVMDSVTRLAHAQREIGIAAGEPCSSRGYPPSVFSFLASMVERAGNFSGQGAITGIYTVLVEGDDALEPVTDAMRSVLDGHIMLSRKLASLGIYPAIDVQYSVSRLFRQLTVPETQDLVRHARELLLTKYKCDEMVEIGAYVPGNNQELDRKVEVAASIQRLLETQIGLPISKTDAISQLKELVENHAA